MRIDAPPFEGADIEEFRGVIKIKFRMATGTWRFQDITDKPELWSIAPALPDTGQIDAVRDWELEAPQGPMHRRGGGAADSIESRLVRDVQCQVRPRNSTDSVGYACAKSGSDPDSHFSLLSVSDYLNEFGL